jgi:hypothetical protein
VYATGRRLGFRLSRGALATDAYFEGFDRDRSGGLSESGFADGIFGVYDADGSDSLDESEFESAVSALNVEL